jgi:predicted DNA-binding transcriptional regulator AlpA
MGLEENLRKIVSDLLREELDKLHRSDDLIPVSEFCRQKGLSRTTIWRQERQGQLRIVRIGRRLFINSAQFRNSEV